MSGLRSELLAAFAGERDEHLAEMRRSLLLAEQGRAEVDFEDVYRRAHSLKGAARAVDMAAAEAVAHRLETLLHAVMTGEVQLDAVLSRGIRRALDAIEDASAAVIEGRPAEVGAAVEELEALLDIHGLEIPQSALAPADAPEVARDARAAGTQLRIETESLDALLRTSSLLVAEIERHGEIAARLRQLRTLARDSGPAWRVTARSGAALAATAPDGRLAAIREITERLVEEFDSADWMLNRLSGALRDDLTRARLMPIETQFGALPRMTRELAREVGKDVIVLTQGMEVRADRAILQESADAVLHLMRNAVAHGIETPEERVAAGKEPHGRILLHADVDAGRLHVRVEDDGRGLDEAALARQAVAAGLMSSDEAARAPGGILRDLIFRSGLSTAGAVTPLAGRGIGMTIVRQTVARLHGELEIDSRPGRGTRFDLWLPVSLVAQRVVLCDCAGQVFALPAPQVKRLETLAAEQVTLLEGRPMVTVGERRMPLQWLSVLLGLGAPERSDTLSLVVVETNGSAMALAVDGLRAAGDWPVAPLPPDLDGGGLMAGTLTLEDERLVLLPSIPALFALAAGAPPPQAPARRPERPAPTILVVDDSVTTRTLEKSILETHGFRVLVSVNGLEALEMLRGTAVDLVISDVEMPQMDGFALLKTLREDDALKTLPVILVTSREQPEDRARGLHLGADAYIVKQRFNQTDLLETIQQLLP